MGRVARLNQMAIANKPIREHQWKRCNCGSHDCPYCGNGLSQCEVCGASGPELQPICPGKFVTAIPWEQDVWGPRYGTDDTYKFAAEWLGTCKLVADWGGGAGYFRKFLPDSVNYTVVDGTQQCESQVVANLAEYHERSDGILLRHVLEMTGDWQAILTNAVAAFRRRMVLVTFTPDSRQTKLYKYHRSWPVYRFNHSADLIPIMRRYLVNRLDRPGDKPGYPERVYFLEKHL